MNTVTKGGRKRGGKISRKERENQKKKKLKFMNVR